jgi:hypothetical protein
MLVPPVAAPGGEGKAQAREAMSPDALQALAHALQEPSLDSAPLAHALAAARPSTLHAPGLVFLFSRADLRPDASCSDSPQAHGVEGVGGACAGEEGVGGACAAGDGAGAGAGGRAADDVIVCDDSWASPLATDPRLAPPRVASPPPLRPPQAAVKVVGSVTLLDYLSTQRRQVHRLWR